MITAVRITTTQALYGFDLDHELDSEELANRINSLLDDIDVAENPEPIEEPEPEEPEKPTKK